MYNRYIPQPDGSYRRSRVGDKVVPIQQPMRHHKPPVVLEEHIEENHYIPEEIPEYKEPRHTGLPPSKQEKSITGFLKQLLPKGLDTGDLLIILLLLLMAGDSSEEQNTAMLTLAFYLFM